MENFIRGHSKHTPYKTVTKEIEKLQAKQEKTPLDEYEKADLEAFLKYKDRYETDYAAMGEEGVEAYTLWSLLDGQRVEGVWASGSMGEIRFEAIEFIFNLYEVEEERRRDLFESVRAIDGIMMQMRKKPKPDGGETRH